MAWPSFARRWAMAAPMPREAPVTMATEDGFMAGLLESGWGERILVFMDLQINALDSPSLSKPDKQSRKTHGPPRCHARVRPDRRAQELHPGRRRPSVAA